MLFIFSIVLTVLMFDQIAEKVDAILSDHSSAFLFGNFSVYHEKWLAHSYKSNEEGRYCYNFSVTFELMQIMDKLTCVPDIVVHYINFLDLFLTTCSGKCFSVVSPHLGFSDHSLICLKIDAKPKSSSDVPFHRPIFQYFKAD